MRSLLLVTLAAALALPACGGGGDGGGADTGGPDRVEPSAWTADVCGSVTSWLDDVERRSGEIGTEAQQAESLRQVKRQLVAFFDEMLARTDRMIAEIEEAGIPDVEDGEAIAEDFQTSMAPLREALADAHARAEELPTDDPQAFARQATRVGEDVENSGTEVQKAFDAIDEKYDTPELDRAFEDEQACQRLENLR